MRCTCLWYKAFLRGIADTRRDAYTPDLLIFNKRPAKILIFFSEIYYFFNVGKHSKHFKNTSKPLSDVIPSIKFSLIPLGEHLSLL